MANDDAERAILVLDASGSMWGQVEGTPKITIARDVIQGLVEDWNPNVALGVTAYGHREKGNCADIETLVPVGPVNGDQVMSAIGSLNPKGKTPLTDAVRQAAETLKYTEERATVLLVSDGKETCDADPCAAATELEANGIDFTVHVVGFDLTEEEKEQLQCVADNTGGKFLSADNAPELHTAMATTVQLVAEPEPEPAGPTGMRLQAVLTEGGDPVKAQFVIKEPEANADGKRKNVAAKHSKPDKPALFELPPGRYFVTAGLGKAKVSEHIEVIDGELTEKTLDLNGGRLRVSASLKEGGAPVTARIAILAPEANENGGRAHISSTHAKPDKPATFELGAGTYLVQAAFGKAEAGEIVEIEAGALTERTIVVGAGRLHVAAALVEDGDPVEALIKVMAPDANENGGRAHISSTHAKPGKPASFELAAGRYYVEAIYGDAKAAREIEIRAGEAGKETIVVGAGRLKLPTRLAEGAEPLTEDGYHTIYESRKDQLGELVYDKIDTGGLSETFSLPAGDYRVVTTYRSNKGNAEARTDVTVEAGRLNEMDAVLDSGILRLKSLLANDGAPLEENVQYEVYEPTKDQLGEIDYERVATGTADAIFSLKSGAYRLVTSFRRNYGNVVDRSDIAIEAGKISEETVVLESGHLKPTALMTEDGEPLTEGVNFEVLEAIKDQLGDVTFERIATGQADTIFSLKAGSYRLTASHRSESGEAFGETDVEIRPGERTETIIVFSDEG
ncbi:MAG: VWA domain-containing protein [Geminicoccaceae bacterium]